jgi:CHAD domain-containing protein
LAKFRAAFIDLLPGRTDEIEALHQFRIRAKALRYAIEFLAPAFAPRLREEVYPAIAKLQERLGKITDHTAAIRIFTKWEKHHPASAEQGASLLKSELAEQVDDLNDFREWWTTERARWHEQSIAS